MAADFDMAVSWLMTAAGKKDHQACAMLAKIYGSSGHKDEDRMIYWHKKAAEYGSADSMFFLGDYYIRDEFLVDMFDVAFGFYDRAARAGTAEMKLKVAKTFDMMDIRDLEENLEKAKYWYEEVLGCGNDKLKLEAAKGLDVLLDGEGREVRDALDIEKAYITYKALAMKGNKEACSLYAYCNEVGNGTEPDMDTAIMFYEKAGETDKADRCKRKKAEAQGGSARPLRTRNVYSHGKEFCREHGSCERTDVEGGNIKLLSKADLDHLRTRVHVNITGIYLYDMALCGEGTISVQHYDFDGNLVSVCYEECEGAGKADHIVSNVYIYDDNVYYVHQYENYEDEERWCEIKCMRMDIGVIEVLYEKAKLIRCLLATEDKLIFYAEYENAEYDLWDRGWMVLDLKQNSVGNRGLCGETGNR